MRKITLAEILQIIKRAEDLAKKQELEGLLDWEERELNGILGMEFFVQ